MNAPSEKVAFDVARIRQDFPILDLKVNGKPLVFLDNAASSQMPARVMDRWVRYQSSQHAKDRKSTRLNSSH